MPTPKKPLPPVKPVKKPPLKPVVKATPREPTAAEEKQAAANDRRMALQGAAGERRTLNAPGALEDEFKQMNPTWRILPPSTYQAQLKRHIAERQKEVGIAERYGKTGKLK